MPFEDKDLDLFMRLGFTNSQAKVYLSLVYLGQSCVHNLVKVAQIDRAETYRVLSQLEKQGFVQRVLVNPCEFKPVSVSELLSALVSRKKAEVTQLEREAKRLQKKKIQNIALNQDYMILASKPEIVLERMKRTYSPVQTINAVFTLCSFRKSAKVFEDMIWRFIKDGTKATFIVDTPENDASVPELLKNLGLYPDFTLRYTAKPFLVPIMIIDNAEVWINTSENANFLEATHLLSNNPRLVVLAQGYFDHLLAESFSPETQTHNLT
jgi:sugar-specific transcriptional regulator TrmB